MPRAKKPAAASGPGKLARRTDGGPGDRQAVRVAPGGDYGDAKALREQQQSAPMRAGGPTTPQGAPPSPVALSPEELDPFRPSDRPGEPITAGVPVGPGSMGPRPLDTVLDRVRALYELHPNEDLLDAIIELEERLG